MRNIKVILQYEGKRYQGWQRQEGGGNTIQGRLEVLLTKMCGRPVEVTGSGRTDAGGHALGQTANFHIDTDMTPNALMEPAINRSLRADVAIDVTLDLLEDMGWPTNRNGTAMLGNCDTTVPVYRDSFIPGANLVAQNNLCRASSQGNRSQQMRCMNDHISSLHAQTLITPLEVAKARQCVARI